MALDLFDAFASTEKTLYANMADTPASPHSPAKMPRASSPAISTRQVIDVHHGSRTVGICVFAWNLELEDHCHLPWNPASSAISSGNLQFWTKGLIGGRHPISWLSDLNAKYTPSSTQSTRPEGIARPSSRD
ncbi:hypothetical protein [Paeniglutamicibacter kerguelensis]|uniref:hypothetical protein n=1 Tax=Paeniglutamicibacter kerguelensis TaxID=254788 RepID=UPI0036242C23